MNDSIREKLSRIYSLVNKGATEGERNAAKLALDRILKKYNLDESVLQNIDLKQYSFRYSTNNERILIISIVEMFSENKESLRWKTWTKEVVGTFTYYEWISIESSFEYFRRHMKMQWIKVVKPNLDRCRKVKTRKKLREELDFIFIDRYLIASNLVDEKKLITIKASEMSQAEITKRLSLQGIEGGQYNKQILRGLLLN
jgi:hypothetical protein